MSDEGLQYGSIQEKISLPMQVLIALVLGLSSDFYFMDKTKLRITLNHLEMYFLIS